MYDITYDAIILHLRYQDYMISWLYDIRVICDIIWYQYRYHVWYQCMPHIIYDIYILLVWYQGTYHKLSCMISEMILSMISKMISIMISYMMARCLYPPLKTSCIEHCQSRALQVQVQDVLNRQMWSSTLLDEALLVLGVQRILMSANATWAFSCSLMQWREAWQDNLLHWCCMQGRPSWSWTRSLQEFTNQLGTPTGFRVTLQYGHNWNSSWTYTVGIPTGVWVQMWKDFNRKHNFCVVRRIPRNSKNICWLGCVQVWSSVVSPFACDSLYSNRSYRTSRSKLSACQQQWSGLELRRSLTKSTNQFTLFQLHDRGDT